MGLVFNKSPTQPRSGKFSIQELPNELLEKLISCIDAVSFLHIRFTCKFFHSMFADMYIRIYYKNWQVSDISTELKYTLIRYFNTNTHWIQNVCNEKNTQALDVILNRNLWDVDYTIYEIFFKGSLDMVPILNEYISKQDPLPYSDPDIILQHFTLSQIFGSMCDFTIFEKLAVANKDVINCFIAPYKNRLALQLEYYFARISLYECTYSQLVKEPDCSLTSCEYNSKFKCVKEQLYIRITKIRWLLRMQDYIVFYTSIPMSDIYSLMRYDSTEVTCKEYKKLFICNGLIADQNGEFGRPHQAFFA